LKEAVIRSKLLPQAGQTGVGIPRKSPMNPPLVSTY